MSAKHITEIDKWYPYNIGPTGPLPLSVSLPTEITFPGSPIRTSVRVALNPDFSISYLNWAWAEIGKDVDGTSIVRWEQQIDITYGGRANSAVVDASVCTFRATNDKRFSRRNPLSPYYNQLSEYTPLWIQLDYGQGFKDKYFGFIHDFAKAWNTTADPYVTLTARGPLHRIGKSKPLKSPLYRASSGTTAGAIKPLAYWPMEDGAQADFFASATPGVPNMSLDLLSDTTVLSSSSAVSGSLSLPTFTSGSSGHATVPEYTDNGFWAAAIVGYSNDMESGGYRAFSVDISGGAVTGASVSLFDGPAPGDRQLQLVANDATGVFDINVTLLSLDSAEVPLYVILTSEQDPLGVDDILTAYAIDETGTIVGTTPISMGPGNHGTITDGYVNGRLTETTIDTVLGHFVVYVDTSFDINVDGAGNAKAMSAFNGERAIPRMRRLCREENIPFYASGIDDDSEECGPQTVGSLITNLREPEKVDGGTIYEYLFGLGYKSHMEYTNQPVSLTLDAALGQVTNLGVPIDNDLDFVNQWTISRPQGSSATVAARKGEAGVTLTDTELVYESSDTATVFEDVQLESIAARYGRRSTVDEDRWPAVSFHLAKNPELIYDWQVFPFGGRLQVLNVYAEVGVTTLDQIYKGHQESWNSAKWEVTLNCAPSIVYQIMELDSSAYSRIDSSSSTLADDLSDSATTFLVDTSDLTELWTTDTAQFPLDIKLYPGTGTAIASGGETIRVASIAPFATDTFSRTETDQWGSMDTGQAWSLFWAGAGGAANDFDVAAGVGTQIVDAGTEYRVAILSDIAANRVRNPEVAVTFTTGISNVTGGSIEPGNLLLRYVNITNYYLCRIEITTAELVNISIHKLVENVGTALTSTLTTAIAYTGQALRVKFAAQGRTLRAKVYDPALPDGVEWQVTAEDDTFLEPGVVGIRSGVAAGNTNVPVTFSYDSFEISNPQQFSVEQRALNGIIKAHKQGTVVRVADMVVIL